MGSHLTRMLLNEGHEVKVVDDRPEVIARLKEELPPNVVITGDGSSPTTLEAAGIARAQVLAAVTADGSPERRKSRFAQPLTSATQ